MRRHFKSPGKSSIDLRYRSLLQKAVRRGAVELLFTTCALLESLGPKARTWLKKRAVVITFEENWPLGCELVFNKSFPSKVAVLVKMAQSAKSRDAAGLGALAFVLSEGDTSVLEGSPEDKSIRIIANAIQRPDDFWKWIQSQGATGRPGALIQNAVRFRNVGLPEEKAFSKAAAYLAVSGALPEAVPLAQETLEFPYMAALDGHTSQGRRALNDIARDLHIPQPQLDWALFYFEGSATSGSVDSVWWERWCRWKFQKVGIPIEEARLLWDPVRPQLAEALAEDAHRLHKEIYKWKMEHRDEVASLKKKVKLYVANFADFQKAQRELFQT